MAYTPYVNKIRGTNNTDYYLRDSELFAATFSAWSSGTAYAVGKIVEYDGKPYICIQATTSSSTTAPSSDTSHWQASTNLADIVASIEAQASTTDEKLTVNTLSIANIGTTWYPIVAVGEGNATRQIHIDAFKYKYEQSQGTSGIVSLELGNDVASIASKISGKIILHGGGTVGSGTLQYGGTTTSQLIIPGVNTPVSQNDPTYLGYVVIKEGSAAVGSSTQPVYVDGTGVVKATDLSNTYAAKSHTHNTSITTGTSTDTSQLTLAHGTKYVLAAGGTTYCFTMPSVGTIPTITLNGSTTTSPSFYAPTGGGTSGQVLISQGTSAPKWVNKPTATGTNTAHGITISNHTTGTITAFASGGSAVAGTNDDAHTLIITAATGTSATVVTGASHSITNNGHTHSLTWGT